MAFVTAGQLVQEGRLVVEGIEKIAKSLPRSNLFLSHSRHDEKYIAGACRVLTRSGASVYVDVHDERLQSLEGSAVPDHLRTAISKCKRLVVLISEHTATSRWIPWELGLADGLHQPRNVATFPVSISLNGFEEDWGTQEYFGLYPQVRHLQLRGRSRPGYVVHDPSNGLYWTLENWISV